MKIDLIAPPFSGHLHPILAMARALADEFDVRVVSTPGMQRRIRDAGLVAVPILSDAAEAQLRAVVDPARAVGSHPWRLVAQFRRALHLMIVLREELLELYRGPHPDLLIADFVLAPAGSVARQLGIPWWTSLPSPCVIETVDGPPAYLGGLQPAGSATTAVRDALGRSTVRIFKQLVHASHRRALARAGLPRLYRNDGSEAAYSPDCILALAIEELEFARRWPAAVHFVGPQLYASPVERETPTFEDGKQHVLVTCGTHLRWFRQSFAEATRRVAATLPDVVFHFSNGDVSSSVSNRVGNFVRYAYIDYAASMGRYDLVFHHGGAGVMYECLRHGKPAIVFPVDYDQFDHAARLEARGLAIRLRRLDDLGQVVRDALSGSRTFLQVEVMKRQVERVANESRVVGLVRAHRDRRLRTAGSAPCSDRPD